MNMKMKYLRKGSVLLLLLAALFFASNGFSESRVTEKKKKEEPAKTQKAQGVTIVALDVPMRATIGKKVAVEVVIGNERPEKVTTILTVTCPTTKQQIGREAETLDGFSSQKIVYTWNTEGQKEGCYIIKAELTSAPDETYTEDNVRQVDILLIK